MGIAARLAKLERRHGMTRGQQDPNCIIIRERLGRDRTEAELQAALDRGATLTTSGVLIIPVREYERKA